VSKVLKVLKELKVLNFWGARGCNIFKVVFTFTVDIAGSGERPDPAPLDGVLLGNGDALGLARRIEGAAANPPLTRFSPQLPGQPGSGGEGLPQPGAGILDDGVSSGTSARGVRLRLEQLGGGPGALPVPDETRHGGPGNVFQVEGEGGGGAGQIAFGHGQDAPLGVGGIRREEEPGAGGTDDADAAQTPVERVGTGGLGEVADGDDGGPTALGGGFQGGHGMADALPTIGTDADGEIVDQLVEDDEGDIEALDEGVEDGQVTRQGEGTTGVGAIGDGEEGNDAPRVATGGIDAGTDGVEGVVLGGEEEGARGVSAGRGAGASGTPGRVSGRHPVRGCESVPAQRCGHPTETCTPLAGEAGRDDVHLSNRTSPVL
jgi:hypothetical protein